ncbi:hypothetical protein SIAM614_21702 [Stappia aggregata IAM 12614]|uniref:Uncharacterized protein n=1 Tax=Roseibium aggregatum (strain ATCC 25650 / DSM 13394 / JCM 20685 / NBRC 16684 / NCIMB 2208 / IAM 12614 / B1) TaxID=384765 RepID=A0P375_ROSAI|nr:hypothetical protein SIAM614_21702 [Stappia aggregata IAM 12614] [Roseibium aggregatum IAM 12614]
MLRCKTTMSFVFSVFRLSAVSPQTSASFKPLKKRRNWISIYGRSDGFIDFILNFDIKCKQRICIFELQFNKK